MMRPFRISVFCNAVKQKDTFQMDPLGTPKWTRNQLLLITVEFCYFWTRAWPSRGGQESLIFLREFNDFIKNDENFDGFS